VRFRKIRRGSSGTDRAGLVGRGGDGVGTNIVPSVDVDGSMCGSEGEGEVGSTYPLLLSHIRLISFATCTEHIPCLNALVKMRWGSWPLYKSSR